MSDNASAGARGEDRCGYLTNDDEPCELPPSRSDDRCHIHTEVGEQLSGSDGDAGDDDYEEMLSNLDIAVSTAREKIQSGRIRDEEKEKIRIKWVRAMAYALNVRRQITTDRDLEELTEEVEQLKELYEE